MKKKILIIDNEIPLPVNFGKRMRTWCFIRALAEENELSLLCKRQSSIDVDQATKELKPYFKNVWIVEPKKTPNNGSAGIVARIQNLINAKPWEIAKAYSKDVEDIFLRILNEQCFDIILTRYIHQGQYFIRNINKIDAQTILDLDDIESVKSERILESEGAQSRYDQFRRKINITLLDQYHKKIKVIDKCIVCSQKDVDYIERRKWHQNAFVIPNSIDVAQYKQIQNYPKHAHEKRALMYCGNLSYGPNAAAAIWFINDVLPRIKKRFADVKLHIVGRNPLKQVYDHADDQTIFVHPNVPSMIPYYEKSSLVIVPLLSGGGTRIKILEALACRRPVVSTTIGAEGLNLTHGKHCLIADEKEHFAQRCIELLKDYDKSKGITEEGYTFVKEHYDSTAVYQMIKEVFNNA